MSHSIYTKKRYPFGRSSRISEDCIYVIIDPDYEDGDNVVLVDYNRNGDITGNDIWNNIPSQFRGRSKHLNIIYINRNWETDTQAEEIADILREKLDACCR